jgi:ABC-type lipoprotein export system ATPase subunit
MNLNILEKLLNCHNEFTDKKKILKNVNGEFRGCELSAIVGPSGCG